VLSVRYRQNFKLICKLTSSVKCLKVHLSVIPRHVFEPRSLTTMLKSTRSWVRRIHSTVSDLAETNSGTSGRQFALFLSLCALKNVKCQLLYFVTFDYVLLKRQCIANHLCKLTSVKEFPRCYDCLWQTFSCKGTSWSISIQQQPIHFHTFLISTSRST